MVNLGDPALGIQWPIPLENSVRSDADLNHPPLDYVTPMTPRRTIIVGAGGQLGRAPTAAMPEAEAYARDELDLHDLESFDWSGVGVIINAAAYTAVDAAENDRATAWSTNVDAVARLAGIARRERATLVHVSSDYVFDGAKEGAWTEDDSTAPLGFYGVTKAAGDVAAASAPRHYIVRTSWVIGDGKNFVATMASLARRGIKPSVVNDQVGRLTFTDTLAAAIRHLLSTGAPFGTYNVSNSGPSTSWADVAAEVFERCGASRDDVTPVTTSEYFADKPGMAPRPLNSVLALSKIEATGFHPVEASEAPAAYLDVHLDSK